jgi:hypothetical protein
VSPNSPIGINGKYQVNVIKKMILYFVFKLQRDLFFSRGNKGSQEIPVIITSSIYEAQKNNHTKNKAKNVDN